MIKIKAYKHEKHYQRIESVVLGGVAVLKGAFEWCDLKQKHLIARGMQVNLFLAAISCNMDTHKVSIAMPLSTIRRCMFNGPYTHVCYFKLPHQFYS